MRPATFRSSIFLNQCGEPLLDEETWKHARNAGGFASPAYLFKIRLSEYPSVIWRVHVFAGEGTDPMYECYDIAHEYIGRVHPWLPFDSEEGNTQMEEV